MLIIRIVDVRLALSFRTIGINLMLYLLKMTILDIALKQIILKDSLKSIYKIKIKDHMHTIFEPNPHISQMKNEYFEIKYSGENYNCRVRQFQELYTIYDDLERHQMSVFICYISVEICNLT